MLPRDSGAQHELSENHAAPETGAGKKPVKQLYLAVAKIQVRGARRGRLDSRSERARRSFNARTAWKACGQSLPALSGVPRSGAKCPSSGLHRPSLAYAQGVGDHDELAKRLPWLIACTADLLFVRHHEQVGRPAPFRRSLSGRMARPVQYVSELCTTVRGGTEC